MNIAMMEDGSTKNQQSGMENGEKKIDFVCARHKKYPVHVQKRQKLVGDVA